MAAGCTATTAAAPAAAANTIIVCLNSTLFIYLQLRSAYRFERCDLESADITGVELSGGQMVECCMVMVQALALE